MALAEKKSYHTPCSVKIIIDRDINKWMDMQIKFNALEIALQSRNNNKMHVNVFMHFSICVQH